MIVFAYLAQGKVDEVLRLMADVRTKVFPHNAMPWPTVSRVEFPLHVRRDILQEFQTKEKITCTTTLAMSTRHKQIGPLSRFWAPAPEKRGCTK